MSKINLDTRGHKCPTPLLMVSNLGIKQEIQRGDELTVISDCENFKDLIKQWALKCNKKILYVRDLNKTEVECQMIW